MKTLRATLKRSILGAATRRTASQWARSLFALFLAGLLAGGPAFAQSPAQDPPASPAPAPTTTSTGASIAPVSSLGVSAHNYTHGVRSFPNILKPYESQHIDPPVLTNSPRIDQLIHDNKLEISLQDAVELALENSMDIAVRRYYPWISDAGLLNAQAGNTGFGTPGAQIVASAERLAAERGFRRIVLHARETATPFYEKAGYVATGETFVEVTIPHRIMVKPLAATG